MLNETFTMNHHSLDYERHETMSDIEKPKLNQLRKRVIESSIEHELMSNEALEKNFRDEKKNL